MNLKFATHTSTNGILPLYQKFQPLRLLLHFESHQRCTAKYQITMNIIN